MIRLERSKYLEKAYLNKKKGDKESEQKDAESAVEKSKVDAIKKKENQERNSQLSSFKNAVEKLPGGEITKKVKLDLSKLNSDFDAR